MESPISDDPSIGDEQILEIPSSPSGDPPPAPRRRRRIPYDDLKQRDWQTFLHYVAARRPPIAITRIRSTHVIEFLQSLDGSGKTLVHDQTCPFFGSTHRPNPPCPCPRRHSWGSLDTLVRRLRAACDAAPSDARPDTNPFALRPVRNYLLHIKDAQATARGIPYSRKRKSSSADDQADQTGAVAAPENAVQLLGCVPGQDGAVQLQICWMPPAGSDGHATPQFFPAWAYPAAVQSMSANAASDGSTSIPPAVTVPLSEASSAPISTGSPPPAAAAPGDSHAATRQDYSTLPEGSVTAAAIATSSDSTRVAVEVSSDQIGGPASTTTGVVPLLGSSGQDAPVQVQFCWMQPPVMDSQATPQFYPTWNYPVSYAPQFPFMPIPTPQKRSKEKVRRVPKQREEDHPAGTSESLDLTTSEENDDDDDEEGDSSSDDEDGGCNSDTIQPVPAEEHNPAPRQHKRKGMNKYEYQKGRDWIAFQNFLENRQPRLTLSRVRSSHVIEYLKYLDQSGKTLVHEPACPYFGNSNPPAPCPCPHRQSWGTLDSLVRRLRSVCEENPDRPDTNPFGIRAIRNYLLQIKDIQATARGIPYSRTRKPKPATPTEVLGDGREAVLAISAAGNSSTNGESSAQTAIAASDTSAAANTIVVEEGSGIRLASSSPIS